MQEKDSMILSCLGVDGEGIAQVPMTGEEQFAPPHWTKVTSRRVPH